MKQALKVLYVSGMLGMGGAVFGLSLVALGGVRIEEADLFMFFLCLTCFLGLLGVTVSRQALGLAGMAGSAKIEPLETSFQRSWSSWVLAGIGVALAVAFMHGSDEMGRIFSLKVFFPRYQDSLFFLWALYSLVFLLNGYAIIRVAVLGARRIERCFPSPS